MLSKHFHIKGHATGQITFYGFPCLIVSIVVVSLIFFWFLFRSLTPCLGQARVLPLSYTFCPHFPCFCGSVWRERKFKWFRQNEGEMKTSTKQICAVNSKELTHSFRDFITGLRKGSLLMQCKVKQNAPSQDLLCS